MMSTLFRNASGLPNDEQVTTARDMAVLAQHLIRDFPEYYGCFQTRYFAYHGRRYRNHNRLLFGYKGTDGIKTGYTRAAGFNLTASVRRDDKHLVAVVLGGRTGGQRDAAMRALLDQSFPKAVAGRPRPVETAPLVASLETPAPPAPPPPVAKKRVFALASAAPAEPASFSDGLRRSSLCQACCCPSGRDARPTPRRPAPPHPAPLQAPTTCRSGPSPRRPRQRAGSARFGAARALCSTATSRSPLSSRRTTRSGTARALPASRRMARKTPAPN